MIDEKNKDTQNTSPTGNFNEGKDKSGASPQSAKDATSTSTLDNLNTESVKETARGLVDQAKSTAGQAYGVATEKATTVIEEKKGDLASGLTSVADTIRQVSSTLRETDEQTGITDTAAKYSETLAGQVEQISRYFERNDVRAMVRDVESFARRNPAVFIGGAFALGILAARFLKSTGTGSDSSSRSNYRSNYGGDNRNFNSSRRNTTGGGSNRLTGVGSTGTGTSGLTTSTGTSSTPTGNTSPGATDYSSNLGNSATSGSGLKSTENKSNELNDKTTTNPS